MKKHNIGRISMLIVLLNVIFGLIYLADKNGVGLSNSTSDGTTQEVVEKQQMQIFADTTVDGEYITMLENIISDQKFSKDDIAIVMSYEWYLTDNINIAGADRYFIKDGEIVIFAADDNFITYVNDVLSEIVSS